MVKVLMRLSPSEPTVSNAAWQMFRLPFGPQGTPQWDRMTRRDLGPHFLWGVGRADSSDTSEDFISGAVICSSILSTHIRLQLLILRS